jgi:hypothetical protein
MSPSAAAPAQRACRNNAAAERTALVATLCLKSTLHASARADIMHINRTVRPEAVLDAVRKVQSKNCLLHSSTQVCRAQQWK